MHDWGTLNQAQRDARYNNSDAVANSQAYMAELRAASEARRAEQPAGLDQPYGPGERNRLDLFPGLAGAPTLAFIHGGYWQRNSRDGSTALGDGVRAHGWSLALPGYTLAPDASLATIVREIGESLTLLRNLVTGPIILSGWSAGGHLAAMGLGHPAVHAGLAISGVFELGPIRDTYLNEKLRLTDDEVESLSPLRLPVGPKPLAIAYGSAELPPLVSDSRALHYHRSAAHAPGPLIPGAGLNHFTILNSLRQPDGMLTRALLALT
ncbi:MAG: alpha/beta hydrolase [Janthinobacterium lividum]